MHQRLIHTFALAAILATGAPSGVGAEEECRHDGCTEIAVEAVRQMILNPDPPLPAASGSSVDEPVDEPLDPEEEDLFGDLESVEVPVERIRRDARAPETSADPESYESQDDSFRSTPLALGFTDLTTSPEAGIDPELLAALPELAAERRSTTYGFLLSDEYLVDETRAQIEELGVRMLGTHGAAYRAELPVDEEALAGVVELPFVHWVGYSLPAQKVTPDLRSDLADPSSFELALVLNLFDDDAEGEFATELERLGIELAPYDAGLERYMAVAPAVTLPEIVALDFVQFVEPLRLVGTTHDESTPTIGADYIRPGLTGLPDRYDGSSIVVGLLDTGAAVSDMSGHVDLDKWACSTNFTTDPGFGNVDPNGHGSHVLGTIAGSGAGDLRYAGVAPGVGSSSQHRVRVGKVLLDFPPPLQGSPSSGITNGMTWMSQSVGSPCDVDAADIVNMSIGDLNLPNPSPAGTDQNAKMLDEMVFEHRQLYVVAAGNDGADGAQTINSWGAAKNALTVGNVLFRAGSGSVADIGRINNSSSEGPTGDGRMKPNVVAPGTNVMSVDSQTTDEYVAKTGTSMAAPHVTGLAATLMERYPSFKDRPYAMRSFLMATSLLKGDDFTPGNNTQNARNTYGLGRVSTLLSHLNTNSVSGGWRRQVFFRSVSNAEYAEGKVHVPDEAERVVFVLTWDEPPASSGATEAVEDDIDLYIDIDDDCGALDGRCGEFSSTSTVDNVEYVIVDDPTMGWYHFRAIAKTVCAASPNCTSRKVGVTALVVEGEPRPQTSISLTVDDSTPRLGDPFTIETTVHNPDFVASGAWLELDTLPTGIGFDGMTTEREDAVSMFFDTLDILTLGNIKANDDRKVTWNFHATGLGPQVLLFRTGHDNNASGSPTVQVTIDPWLPPDLTIGFQDLSDPVVVVDDPFEFKAVVMNVGDGDADESVLRFYRSTDNVISPLDDQEIFSVGTPVLATLDQFVHEETFVESQVGFVWYGACVDPTTHEENVDNQCSVIGKRLVVNGRPDLTITDADLSLKTALPGSAYKVEVEVTNEGSAFAHSTQIEYRLFTIHSDGSVSISSLGTGADLGVLDPGDVVTEEMNFVAPMIPGTYQVQAALNPVPNDNNPVGETAILDLVVQ